MAVSRRTRAARWGGALLVALAPLPWLGFGSAQAADVTVYATVTGHEPFSAAANQADYWGDNCEKIVDSGSMTSYVLTQNYDLVVVKAASKNVDPYTNTLFENASEGETVWADTNGNSTFDPGGKGGDKAISHIIVCGEGETESPSPSTSISTSESVSPSTSISTSKSPSTSISTSESVSPSTSISTSRSVSPSTSISTSESVSPSTSISTSESVSPSTSISTSESGRPSESSKPAVTESESSGAAALPQTGSDVPVAGAVGISLLLIGVGVLLLLGPGRLIPATYHRKH
jgi:hypothetical protein